MAGRLTFDRGPVKRCLDHALQSDEHRLTYNQQFAGEQTTDAGLWLVKDQGVYLMSNAKKPDIVEGDHLFVAYAKEADPTDPEQEFDDWWEAGRKIMGNDDCVEFLPTTIFDHWLRGSDEHLMLDVTEEEIRVVEYVDDLA